MHVTVVIFRNGKAIHKLIHWLTFSTTPGLLTLVPIAERERRPEQALEEKLRENAASTAVSPRSVEPLISLPVFSLSQGKRPSSAGEQVVVLDNLTTGFDWAVLLGAKLGDRRCRRSIMRRRADRAASD